MLRYSIQDDGVSNELSQLQKTDDLRVTTASKRTLGRVQACYLVATALATIGWVWLIAWCALQLV
jgi:hypothetical protein